MALLTIVLEDVIGKVNVIEVVAHMCTPNVRSPTRRLTTNKVVVEVAKVKTLQLFVLQCCFWEGDIGI